MMEDELRESLRDKVDKLDEFIRCGGKTKGEKKFRLPLHIRLSQRKAAKKNRIIVFYIHNNLNISAGFGEFKNGMIRYKDVNYDGAAGGIGLWNGRIPATIITEWNHTPLTFKDADDTVSAQKIIIRSMETKEADIAGKKKLGIGAVIGLVIAAGVIGYVLFSGGT